MKRAASRGSRVERVAPCEGRSSGSARPSPLAPRPCRAFLLIDCLVYIALLLVLLGLAFMTFYRTLDNSKALNRAAADIARALQAGERWRADVRASTAPPRMEQAAGESVLHLPRANGEVLYVFRNGAVERKDGTRTTADWTPFLGEVKASRMLLEPRQHVTAWRWELQLATANEGQRVKPLFTFQAVPEPERKP